LARRGNVHAEIAHARKLIEILGKPKKSHSLRTLMQRRSAADELGEQSVKHDTKSAG
jgi:hypothetical protein